jgi:hypothetical protein
LAMALASGPSALLCVKQTRTLARRSPPPCVQHSILTCRGPMFASRLPAGSSARVAINEQQLFRAKQLVVIAMCSWILTSLHAAEVILEQIDRLPR